MAADSSVKDGILPEKLRRKLWERGFELGLNDVRLGYLLGVNWSTVRKWRTGAPTACRCGQLSELLDRIGLKPDRSPRRTPPDVDYTTVPGLPKDLRFCKEGPTEPDPDAKDKAEPHSDTLQEKPAPADDAPASPEPTGNANGEKAGGKGEKASGSKRKDSPDSRG